MALEETGVMDTSGLRPSALGRPVIPNPASGGFLTFPTDAGGQLLNPNPTSPGQS
jgi:hypothetical protein